MSARNAVAAIATVLMLAAVPAIFALVPDAAAQDSGPAPQAKKWTIIIFMFSDSSQHGGALNSYYSMLEHLETRDGWSDDDVNVLIFQDRHIDFAPDRDPDTHAYYVREGKGKSKEIAISEVNPEWVDEVNMGHRETLISFGTYAITHYPAERYVVMTRSAGWWPDNFGEDDSSGDNINTHEMRSALAVMSKVAGKKIDVLAIMGCTSGMFEHAYDYSPFADYYVGTETYSNGHDWRLFYMIKDLRANVNMTPADFSVIIAKEYMRKDRLDSDPYETLTSSASNLTRIQEVANATDALALALKADLRNNIYGITEARAKTQAIDNYLRVDLREIAKQLNRSFPKGIVHDRAVELMAAYDRMVLFSGWQNALEGGGINVSTATGLSIYFVQDAQTHGKNAVDAYRSRLHFSLQYHWLQFLDEYFMYEHTTAEFPSGPADIAMGAFMVDITGWGYANVLVIQVWTDKNEPLKGARVFVNGIFAGETMDKGLFVMFEVPQGEYYIAVTYGDFTKFAQVESDGPPPRDDFIMDATPADLDRDGHNDDAIITVHRRYSYEPIPGVMIITQFVDGYTNEHGAFYGLNYAEGQYWVYGVTGETFFQDSFYSEGEGTDALLAEPRLVDYEGSGNVDDLDLRVTAKGEPLDGAICYVDGNYVGMTSGGRVLGTDYKNGWHWVDAFYKPTKEVVDAHFEDVYIIMADLNGDGLDDTMSVNYDVDTKEPAMDVKVSMQIIATTDGDLRGLAYDNFTAVRGDPGYRFLNFSSERTRFANMTLTLMDKDDFMMDRVTNIGIWLEVPANEAPEASVFVRPSTHVDVGEEVTLNGTNSKDIDGNVTEYMFDFGDGTNSEWTNMSVLTHTYTSPGNFTINLMVKDDRGLIDDRSNHITIWVEPRPTNIPPEARLFVRPTYTYPWEPVEFNGSTSFDEDDDVVGFCFNFGDGTTSGWTEEATLAHVYNNPGNYTAYVKVRDEKGTESEWSNGITVWVKSPPGNSPPHAYLTVRPSFVSAGEVVTFNASGSWDDDGYVYLYLFDFGDGTNSSWVTDPVVTHVYTVTGLYTATLMVEDNLDAASEPGIPRNVDVTGNAQPRPYVYARPYYVDEGGEIVFNASGSSDEDGQVAQFFFDFGDGSTSGWTTESTLTHKYERPGDYIVQVRVKDDTGQESTYSSKITVTVKEAKAQGSPYDWALSAGVIAFFVLLMVGGVLYERKKERLSGFGLGETDQLEPLGGKGDTGMPAEKAKEEEKEEEEQEEREEEEGKAEEPPIETIEMRAKPTGTTAEAEIAEGAVPGGTELSAGLPATKKTVATQPGHAPKKKRFRCSGCSNLIEIGSDERPIRVTCSKCGKSGVIR